MPREVNMDVAATPAVSPPCQLLVARTVMLRRINFRPTILLLCRICSLDVGYTLTQQYCCCGVSLISNERTACLVRKLESFLFHAHDTSNCRQPRRQALIADSIVNENSDGSHHRPSLFDGGSAAPFSVYWYIAVRVQAAGKMCMDVEAMTPTRY